MSARRLRPHTRDPVDASGRVSSVAADTTPSSCALHCAGRSQHRQPRTAAEAVLDHGNVSLQVSHVLSQSLLPQVRRRPAVRIAAVGPPRPIVHPVRHVPAQCRRHGSASCVAHAEPPPTSGCALVHHAPAYSRPDQLLVKEERGKNNTAGLRMSAGGLQMASGDSRTSLPKGCLALLGLSAAVSCHIRFEGAAN